MKISRHDYTEAQRDLFNKVVEIGVIDAVELGCIMANCGLDIPVITEMLIQAAYISTPEIRINWRKALQAYSAATRPTE